METAEYQSDIFDRHEARAEARGKAGSLVLVLEARGVHLTEEQRDQVMSCADVDKLDGWLKRAVAATSADDIFKD